MFIQEYLKRYETNDATEFIQKNLKKCFFSTEYIVIDVTCAKHKAYHNMLPVSKN